MGVWPDVHSNFLSLLDFCTCAFLVYRNNPTIPPRILPQSLFWQTIPKISHPLKGLWRLAGNRTSLRQAVLCLISEMPRLSHFFLMLRITELLISLFSPQIKITGMLMEDRKSKAFLTDTRKLGGLHHLVKLMRVKLHSYFRLALNSY